MVPGAGSSGQAGLGRRKNKFQPLYSGEAAATVEETKSDTSTPARLASPEKKLESSPGVRSENLRRSCYDSIDCIRTADLAQKFLRRRQIHIFFALEQLGQLFDFVPARARADRQ